MIELFDGSFKTQDAINCLEFIRSERYGDINL